ncbi:MAG: TIM barrel protein [Acetobacteraceae bacterium]|nr:TIM barrel protein [Acetobacteraceae bacterium]
MPKPGPLSLNTVTVRDRWDLAQCIEGCARHGIPGISPWRDKLAEMGVQRAARRIREAGLSVTGLCRGGMFTAADKAGRRAAIDDNRRAIEEAHILGTACLVMVCGGLPPGSKDLPGAREMVRDGLHEILPEARAAGVALALEPLHPMTCADRSVLASLAPRPGAAGFHEAEMPGRDPGLHGEIELADPARAPRPGEQGTDRGIRPGLRQVDSVHARHPSAVGTVRLLPGR